MKPQTADDPAVTYLQGTFAAAIEGRAEALKFERSEQKRLHVSYRLGGLWQAMAAPPEAIQNSVARRLASSMTSLPRSDDGIWLRLDLLPTWSLEQDFLDPPPRASFLDVTFTDLHAAEVPDFSSTPWQLVLTNPVLCAQASYLSGRYDETFRLLTWMSPRKHPDALALLAHMYKSGLGTETDKAKAEELIKSIKYPDSQWCLVGNIVEGHKAEPGGVKWVEGTKHFKPGAKVYCLPPQWGDGYENIKVVGRHRISKRLVTMVIRSEWVTNWRAKVVYSPSIVRRLNKGGIMWTSEIQVRGWVKALKGRCP